MMPWQPVVDGDIGLARPMDGMVAGTGKGIEVMGGTDTDEHRLFLVPGGAIDQVTAEALVFAVPDYWIPVEATLAAHRTERRGDSVAGLVAVMQGGSDHPGSGKQELLEGSARITILPAQ